MMVSHVVFSVICSGMCEWDVCGGGEGGGEGGDMRCLVFLGCFLVSLAP